MAIMTHRSALPPGMQLPAQRIVSLVPSQTELLYDLGLDETVAGITKFCIHPEHWFRSKPRVGGTKNVHIDRVLALHPDLIIANKEENLQAEVEALAEQFPVWLTDIHTLGDAVQMIRDIGLITGRAAPAEKLAANIQNAFAALPLPQRRIRTAYFIWKDPWMTVGGDTFIHHMMERAGFENVYGHRHRYPETNVDQLATEAPELILLSSEPFPFGEKHREALQSIFPQTPVLLVDGEAFSWYGSRLLRSPAAFRQLQAQLRALSLF